VSQTISCEEAKKILSNEGAQLVDVRTPEEFSQGSLPKSINVPLQVISSAGDSLDKTKPVVLYCVSGARTKMAKSQLDSMGFEQVYDLGSFQNYLSCE